MSTNETTCPGVNTPSFPSGYEWVGLVVGLLLGSTAKPLVSVSFSWNGSSNCCIRYNSKSSLVLITQFDQWKGEWLWKQEGPGLDFLSTCKCKPQSVYMRERMKHDLVNSWPVRGRRFRPAGHDDEIKCHPMNPKSRLTRSLGLKLSNKRVVIKNNPVK